MTAKASVAPRKPQRAKVTERVGEQRRSSAKQLVREIKNGLYLGRYVAGQRLVESDIMERYEVSRSTVREALQSLASDGIVILHRFRGAQIRHLTRTEAFNVLLIMEMLLGLAARQAAANIDKSGYHARFKACAENLLAAERDSSERSDIRRARDTFYRILIRTSDNEELIRIMPNVQVYMIGPLLEPPKKQRVADYQRISNAILRGDQKAAELAGRRHTRNGMDRISLLADEVFASEDDASKDKAF